MIGIVGCGIIGSSWAATFLAAGHEVLIWDSRLEPKRIRAQVMQIVEGCGFELPSSARVDVVGSVYDFARGFRYIQESIVEDLEAKRRLFAELDRVCEPHTILATSSSALSASKIGGDLPGRERILVSHPATPPHAMPAVEIVPAPFTSDAVFQRTWELMEQIGQVPVHVLREVEGFAMNRMQAVLVFSMLEMIADGIVTPEGADAIIRESFGMRWSILGPLEGVHLNAPGGIRDYFTRYRPLFASLCSENQMIDQLLSPEKLDQLESYALSGVPIPRISDRRAWRDSRLIAMKKWKEEGVWNE